jgi:hypothetical protein
LIGLGTRNTYIHSLKHTLIIYYQLSNKYNPKSAYPTTTTLFAFSRSDSEKDWASFIIWLASFIANISKVYRVKSIVCYLSLPLPLLSMLVGFIQNSISSMVETDFINRLLLYTWYIRSWLYENDILYYGFSAEKDQLHWRKRVVSYDARHALDVIFSLYAMCWIRERYRCSIESSLLSNGVWAKSIYHVLATVLQHC